MRRLSQRRAHRRDLMNSLADARPARNLRPPDCYEIIMVPVTDLATARIRRHNVLGGLIHEYERAASRSPAQP